MGYWLEVGAEDGEGLVELGGHFLLAARDLAVVGFCVLAVGLWNSVGVERCQVINTYMQAPSW